MAQEIMQINPRGRRKRRKSRGRLTKAKRAAAARLGWRRRKHGGSKRRRFASRVRRSIGRRRRSRR